MMTGNEELNDKGLIYVRLGPPNDRIVTVHEQAPFNESWLYYETKEYPRMTFHFVLENSIRFWRFTPIINNPLMLEDRITWDNLYYNLLVATAVERLSYEHEMATQSQTSVKTGLTTDRHSWNAAVRPLPMPYTYATFRNKNQQSQFEIYSLIPVAEVFKSQPASVHSITFEKGIAFHNTEWKRIIHIQDSLRFDRNAHNYIDSYQISVPPDSYHVALYGKPLNTLYLGGYTFSMRVPDYSTPGLHISDILFSDRIEPVGYTHKFVRNGLLVRPNPTRRYKRTDQVWVYFEIYNLTLDTEHKAQFDVTYTLQMKQHHRKGFARLLKLFSRGKQAISLTSSRDANTSDSVEFLGIDAGKAEPGEYELTIAVTDKATKQRVEKSGRIVLY